MVDRKSLIQVKFRLRQDILRKLERDAKRGDRSTNDEVGRRLEESYRFEEERQRLIAECERLTERCERMAEERQMFISAMINDLGSHPNPKASKAAFEVMEESTERDFQDDNPMEEILSTQGKKS
jgi:hypothetical protein